MSGTWKPFILPALAAVVAASLLAGAPSRPPAALAANCAPDDTGTLVIHIIDLATDDLLSVGGTTVLIVPDPEDFDLDNLVTDSDISDAGALQDSDQASGVIRFEGACATAGSETYEVLLSSLPTGLEDCDVETFEDSTQLDEGATALLQLVVDCTEVWAELSTTQTPGATSTPVPTPGQDSVEITASSPSVECGETALLAVVVRSSAGNPLPGAGVTVATTLGSISPASGHVAGSNGLAAMTFVAPSASTGTALVTATSGGASGSLQIAVTCADVLSSGGGTVVETTGGASLITPPSTGDAGLLPR